MRRVACGVVVALLGGCSPPPCGLALCDIRDAACQQRLAAATACAREAPVPEVPVRVISAAEYQAEASAESAQTDPVRFDRTMRGLALLDLAPPGWTLERAARETAWAAAYYDSHRGGITVIDRGERMDSYQQVTLLVHEYTHALQHLRGGILPRRARTSDESLAERAVIEGEAVLMADFAELALLGDDVAKVPWAQVWGGWKQQARLQMAYAEAPALVADRTFIYPYGAALVWQAWDANRWPAVGALFGQPPTSSRQVMAGLASEPADDRVSLDTVALLDLPAGFELVAVDRLGAWLLDTFLWRSSLLYQERRDELVRSLARDRFAIHYQAQDGILAVTWRLRFDGSARSWPEVELREQLRPVARLFRVDGDLVIAASNSDSWLDRLAGLPWKPLPAEPEVAPPMTPAPRGCLTATHPR